MSECPYCREKAPRALALIPDVAHVSIQRSILVPHLPPWLELGVVRPDRAATVKINYCPMCGRDLRRTECDGVMKEYR